MVERLLALVDGWEYDVVSFGIPAQVHSGRVVHEPVNLGSGWTTFDFAQAFGKPTKVVNDAAMQAVGSYDGGRMLFLGLGTGLGSAVIDDGLVEPMELGHLPFRQKNFEEYVGTAAMKRLGKKRWRKAVLEAVDHFYRAMQPDYVVLGGGNAKELAELPDYARRGDNLNAFKGGFRLWETPDRVPLEQILAIKT